VRYTRRGPCGPLCDSLLFWQVSYHHHRPKTWGRNARAEKIATVVVLVLVIATLLVFLLIYHDLPLRLSNPGG
jgi:hypothetical protein